MKATAVAPSNIAFIKYWGLSSEKLRIPTNSSISMNLSGLTTTTTVEFSDQLERDDISVNNEKKPEQIARVAAHLDRIRAVANSKVHAKVMSQNNFPTATGLSSSASGFAALTVATTAALNMHLSEKELSIIARMGSGSASRSIPNGFVEWYKGNSSDTCYAETIYPADWWDIVDVVVCVSAVAKTVPTTIGQTYVTTSPFFKERLSRIDDKIAQLKKSIASRDFEQFGEIAEKEALELHAIMLTSTPSLIYMLPETMVVINKIMQLRKAGLPVYFTLNTGQNIHVLCEKKMESKLIEELKKLPVKNTLIANHATEGARIIESNPL